MSKHEENIFAEERKQLIVDLVNEQVKTTVADLCQAFSVSPATIRNDLRELEFAGLLKRTHGGAMSNKKVTFDMPYQDRLVERKAEKQAIGKLAAEMVREGDKIIIDVGTTTIELAMYIAEVPNITIVTSDLEVAYYMNAHSSANILVTGGFLRSKFNSLFGQVALQAMEGITVDKAFISAEGFTPEKGATNTDPNIAQLKSKYVECAEQVIILCDHAKLGKSAFMKFADVGEVDLLITDENADMELVEQLRNKGVEVELAQIEQ
ncbi:MAG: DeoR/GlpR family DNA-binding transcription regulator [Christensenellaceae bacterium]